MGTKNSPLTFEISGEEDETEATTEEENSQEESSEEGEISEKREKSTEEKEKDGSKSERRPNEVNGGSNVGNAVNGISFRSNIKGSGRRGNKRKSVGGNQSKHNVSRAKFKFKNFEMEDNDFFSVKRA